MQCVCCCTVLVMSYGSFMSRSYLLGVFAFSLALRLWFNFATQHPNNAGTADGSEYLRLAEALRQFLSNPFGDITLLSGFKQSGPVFPLFVLLCQKAGELFGVTQPSYAPIFGQCFLSSVADVFLCLTANLLWGARTAQYCAVFTIFYPAFLINSGRLYSESFSTSLCVIVLYLMCLGFSSRRRIVSFIGLGAGLVTLQLTRSVMILLSLAALPLTLIQERKHGAIKAVGLVLLGMALILLPWLFTQKAIFNKASLVVDRVGNYNLFVGTNPDISGWLSYPYPNGVGVESRPALEVLKSNVKVSAGRFFKLLLDKPYRLAKFPWNDFRTAAGAYTYELQVFFHQLLLLLAVAGICLCFFENDDGKPVSQSILNCRALLLLYMLGHSIYWFFITVPRYNLTAMPVVILFSAAACAAFTKRLEPARRALLFLSLLVCLLCARVTEFGSINRIVGNPMLSLFLLSMLKAVLATVFFVLLWRYGGSIRHYKGLSKGVHISVSILSIFLIAYPARANGRAFEWVAELRNKNDKIVQHILHTIQPGEQSYLLIDTDGAKDLVENGRVTANGVRITEPLVPGIAFTQDFSAEKVMGGDQIYFECEWIYDCMTRGAGIASSQVRQWFVLPLPPEVVASAKASGDLAVEIENVTGTGSFKVFGSYLPEREFPTYLNSSWEKAFYGVENDRGFTDSRYDFKFAAAAPRGSSSASSSPDLSSSPGLQTGTFNLLLLCDKAELPKSKPAFAKPLPSRLGIAAGADNTYKLDVLNPDGFTADEIWLVRFWGRARSSKGEPLVEPKLKVLLTSRSGKNLIYPSRWMPRQLPNSKEPVLFDYSFPMKPSLLQEKISALEISFECTRGAAEPGLLEIEDLHLDIQPIASNPISHRSKIF